MRFATLTAFDDFVPATASTEALAVYTPAAFNDRLGTYDQFAMQMVIDDALNANQLSYAVQHSADGRTWLDKMASNTPALSTTTTVQVLVIEAGTNPLLGFVRIAMWFASSNTAHVKLHFALRDGR